MKTIRIGCGQLTWKDMSEIQVLAEIAIAGYDGAPASPLPGESSTETLTRFESVNLSPAPGYLSGAFWREDQETELLARAKEHALFSQEMGCTELYIAAGGFDDY